MPGYLERRLRAGETAGVVLFGPNVPVAAGARRLTAAIQRAADGEALIAADQEGGAVRTLRFADSPRELAATGVNVNLAPVADVAGPDSVMAGRAFPADVPARVVAASRALLAFGVLPTVKHFPGFGRATENTDDAPVTIDATRAELNTDIAPFRASIDAGVPLVMASHALYPALDAEQIASQSPAVLQELLRAELGFEGVVMTDSLEAEAVLARSSVEVAAERSLAAGADLLLMTGRGSWIRVFPHLLRRARRSPALRARISESAARVDRLRARLGPRARR
ncbi:MAG: beta-N-acetylhexosaminidase [Thermoleophilaceae bacterium]|jgi:beta-N-acetylhexosaminidase|nr:beta-N-acetylhexosaminidase [Thermoleophilaceae bacterium]